MAQRRDGEEKPERGRETAPSRPEVSPDGEEEALRGERIEFLSSLEQALELPMAILGLAWLALTALELIRGLPPLLVTASLVIWVIFLLEFALKFLVAPTKLRFLRSNVLTMLALLLPALRVFRAARILRMARTARAARGLRLARVFGSLNRGMRSLGASMGRRGLGYALGLTLLVLFGGSAGIHALEGGIRGGLNDYGEALWWTAMILTTMGSGYWPITPEGRILCILLSLYSFGVFGYFTAALATFFIGREAEEEGGEVAGSRRVEALRGEVRALLEEVRRLQALGGGLEGSGSDRKDA